ncbi:MAG: lipoate--protein ligase family protein [Minisyncoccales bacterium]
MENWRILKREETDNSYKKMALDEAILNSVAKGKAPATLRFYNWNHPAVAIGYFQAIKKVVDIEACKRDKVEIFRRMTGGGAVYKDPTGEFNYSLIIKESAPGIPKNIMQSYRAIEQGIIEGLNILGLKAKVAGINDIVVNQKKISGNAQTRKRGVILQHGTLLLDFNIEKMATYLKIPKEKLSDKGIKNIKERVGTITEYLPNISLDDIEKALIKGFCKTFKVSPKEGKITNKEKEEKEKLYKKKYSTKEWNYWR